MGGEKPILQEELFSRASLRQDSHLAQMAGVREKNNNKEHHREAIGSHSAQIRYRKTAKLLLLHIKEQSCLMPYEHQTTYHMLKLLLAFKTFYLGLFVWSF